MIGNVVILIQTGVYFAEGSSCAIREEWNMQICENEHYAKVRGLLFYSFIWEIVLNMFVSM